jgi:plastocyanin
MNDRRLYALAALVLLLTMVLALSGCSSPTPPPSSSAPPPAEIPSATPSPSSTAPAKKTAAHTIIEIRTGSFSPAQITVKKGTQVVWSNTTKTPHGIAFDDGSLSSPLIEAGDVAGHTFTKTGTYKYHDSLYPNVKGTVEVN